MRAAASYDQVSFEGNTIQKTSQLSNRMIDGNKQAGIHGNPS
jgi:hypothetical protein